MKKKSAGIRQRSLRFKLLLMIVAALTVLTAVLSVVSTQFIYKSTNSALEQSMQETAAIAANHLSDYISLKVSLVGSIANRVGALYSDYLTEDYEDCDIDYFVGRLADMATAYEFDLIFAIDSKGYSRTAMHSNFHTLAPEYYTAVADGGASSYLSDVIADSGALGGSVVNISVPIADANGSMIGVLVAKMDASVISELVTGINVGSKGSTFVMDNDGVCIAHTDPAMCFGGELFAQYKDNPDYASLNQLWTDMQEETSGYTRYEYNGSRLAAFDTVEGTNNWTIAVTCDEEEFMTTARSSMFFCIGIGLALLLVISLACYVIVRSITQRIERISKRIEGLAAGDLANDVKHDAGGDEVAGLNNATASLIQSLSAMIENLNIVLSDMADGQINAELKGEYVGDFTRIKTSVERNLAKLGALVEQISRTSEEVSSGSAQIADGASGLAQGAAEQSRTIEELYTAVRELSTRAKEIADPGSRFLDEDEDEPSDQGDEARLQSAPSIVDKLSIAMDSISQRITAIRKISSVIFEIASDTGMLALNASVEATHAGEYGKGFAVIAAEVRELSEKCSVESRNAEQQLESITRAVARGNQVVAFTVDSVAQISGSLSQIEISLSQIAGVIEETAATAEESAAGSQELSAQAEALKSLASGFRVENKNDNLDL